MGRHPPVTFLSVTAHGLARRSAVAALIVAAVVVFGIALMDWQSERRRKAATEALIQRVYEDAAAIRASTPDP